MRRREHRGGDDHLGRCRRAPALSLDPRHAAPPDRRRRLRRRDRQGPRPVVETNSVSTLMAHARTGLPGITADTWLLAHPLPPEVRSVALVAPVIEPTIGLVTRAEDHPSPVVAELMSSFERLELDSSFERITMPS
ncbi:hypothetical protein FSW04_18115 [Baekduia soli]|uniref:LysR substrate-binding domain-containing protein n=1 Tax=Baekduia soli TaxID=496014 RepID=A0A5B8U8A7_9ACTN|nr:LysR substrate-binding domain-containing protein [Baekduia soli]QEC49304.1 hypothetical protein FSW04_18115 [Baekduia soli]